MSARVVMVQMFAVARELAGQASVSLELPTAATVGDVRRALLAHVPGLERLGPRLLLAVNAEYAKDDAPLPAEADVACIPPVSGG